METHETRMVARATALAGLVEAASTALNGCYRSTLSGGIVTVSDGDDWRRKTVTTDDGDATSEPSIAVVQAIETGWYVRLDDAPRGDGGEGE